MNGIQEVSGSIPLISTKKILKSKDFRIFLMLLSRKNDLHFLYELIYQNAYQNRTRMTMAHHGLMETICI